MKNIIKTYLGLPKSIYILCCATLINRLGDFVVPFLTLFLTQKLNMSTGVSGMFVTCASLLSIPASIIGGKISDYVGRKKVYLLAQGLSGIFLILCAIVKNDYLIIALILVSTFFNGFVRPAFDALLIDCLPITQRQSGISLNYLCMNVGAAIGPIVAGLLFNNFLQLFFVGDGITSLIAVYLVLKNVSEPGEIEGETNNVDNSNECKEQGSIVQVFIKRPQLGMFFALFFVYLFVYSQHRFVLPLTVNDVLKDRGPEVFGQMMSVNAITVVLLTIFITSAIKKYHELTSMMISGVCFAVGYGILAFVHTIPGFLLSTFIWSIGEIICTISAGVFIADNSPINYRARISAIQNIVYWGGSSLSILIGGIVVNSLGFSYIWSSIFIIAMISSALMYLLKIYCVSKDKVQLK